MNDAIGISMKLSSHLLIFDAPSNPGVSVKKEKPIIVIKIVPHISVHIFA